MKLIGNKIKARIKEILQPLTTEGFLNDIIITDFSIDPLSAESQYSNYPLLFIGPASIESSYAYIQSNNRTYKIRCLLLQQTQSQVTNFEDIRDNVIEKLETNFDLSKIDDGARILPISSEIGISVDKKFVIATFDISVETLYTYGT